MPKRKQEEPIIANPNEPLQCCYDFIHWHRNADPNNPEQSAELISRMFMPFGMAQQNGRKGIIYNLNDKPEEMTKEQVEDTYQRKGILYIRSKKTPTQPIL